MRTREVINTSSEVLKTQEKTLSKAVMSAMKEFGNRENNLIDNPFAEYWIEVNDILTLSNTSSAEETTYKLWKLFWVTSINLRKIIERDRDDLQVLNMLRQVWLGNMSLPKFEKRR